MTGEQADKTSQIIDAIITAGENQASEDVRAHAHSLHQHIRETGAHLSEDDWRRLFATLKNGRIFDCLRALAELLLQAGQDEYGIRRFYAQGLIEAGKMNAAISVLLPVLATANTKLADRQKITDPEELEAVGLVGRAYKQCFVEFARQSDEAGLPLSQAAKEALRCSIKTYGSVIESGNQSSDGWHEINYVAVAKLAEKLGIIARHSSGADQLAANLIKRHRKEALAGENPWPAATVGEAYLAFGDWRLAARFYGLFANHPSIDAFKLGSAIRQLEDIWRLDRVEGKAGQILQALKARLVTMPGGELELPRGEIQSLGNDLDQALEAVFGRTHPIKIEWFETGLKRAKSVARIMVNNKPLATGFLVSGKMLSSHLEDKLYLLTNAHVLSEPPAHWKARPPHAARVIFEEADHTDQDNGYGCKLVWQSGVGQLDASLIELSPDVEGLEPFPLADDDLYCKPGPRGPGEEAERVNVIGHPGSEKLSISLQNNEIIGVGCREEDGEKTHIYYHYKTPTLPGNSGSPVCYGDDWAVYALHHAGPRQSLNQHGVREYQMKKLVGFDPCQQANEGISILSIRNQIHRDLSDSKGQVQGRNPVISLSADRALPAAE